MFVYYFRSENFSGSTIALGLTFSWLGWFWFQYFVIIGKYVGSKVLGYLLSISHQVKMRFFSTVSFQYAAHMLSFSLCYKTLSIEAGKG